MQVSGQVIPVVEEKHHPWVLLVVDGERSARDRFRKVAEQGGFRVIVTEDTRKIIGLIETHAVNAMVLDVGKPADSNGLETLAGVCRKYPELQVAACSSQPSVDSVLAAIKAGACDYLQKPLQSEEIASLLVRLQERLEHLGVERAPGQNGRIHIMARRNWIVPLAELEREAILSTLQQLRGNMKLAAKLLGVGKTTLYRKMKEYGLTRTHGPVRNRRAAKAG